LANERARPGLADLLEEGLIGVGEDNVQVGQALSARMATSAW
jgi:hypothetical protein